MQKHENLGNLTTKCSLVPKRRTFPLGMGHISIFLLREELSHGAMVTRVIDKFEFDPRRRRTIFAFLQMLVRVTAVPK